MPDSNKNSEPSTTDAVIPSANQNKSQTLQSKGDRRQGPSPITVKLSDNAVNVGKKLPNNAKGDGPSNAAGDTNPSTKISGKTNKQSTESGEAQPGVPTVSEVMEQMAKVARANEEVSKGSESKVPLTAEEVQASLIEKTAESKKTDQEEDEDDDDGLAQMEKAAESLMAVIDEVRTDYLSCNPSFIMNIFTY